MENEIPNTSSFITTPDFNRLTKISLEEKMEDAENSLMRKTEVKNALDLRVKNGRK